MNSRKFADWLNTFRKSINGYDYYVDFDKVCENAKNFELEIHILNALVGAGDVEGKFRYIAMKYPECLKVIPILLAVRESKIYCQDENGALVYDFGSKNLSIDQCVYFMHKTGLFNLLQHHIVRDLHDYVTGVEAGLDSNGRKNRGGNQMEKLVENFLKRSCVEYYSQMCLEDIERTWHIDLSLISSGGTSTKKFDFVVKTERSIYTIETNFYTSGGSKLNETSRSYKMIAEEAGNIDGFKFVWITDGGG